MSLIGQGLADAGVAVQLFAPAAAVRRLGTVGDRRPVPSVDFDTQTDVSRFGSSVEALTSWIGRLPDLGRHIVVSDNLPEVLAKYPDAIISGSFFWHETVAAVSDEYKSLCRDLLVRHQPTIVSSDLLTPPHLRAQRHLITVGLYGARRSQDFPKSSLLISAGWTSVADAPLASVVASLGMAGPPKGYREVLVEPRLMPSDAPPWMKPADFSPRMYDRTLAAIVRPGTGTITECLASGTWIIATSEQGNDEMEFNAEMLLANGLGARAAHPSEAIDLARRFARDSAARTAHRAALDALDWTGVQDACNILMTATGAGG